MFSLISQDTAMFIRIFFVGLCSGVTLMNIGVLFESEKVCNAVVSAGVVVSALDIAYALISCSLLMEGLYV